MQALRELRKQRGITQTEFAQRIGISQIAASRYERGERAVPFKIAEKIRDEFGLKDDEMIQIVYRSA